jgi:hypothetical protein
MSEVEALLNVDAGRIPPGAVVFRARDPESEVRRLRTVLAVGAGLVTVGLAIAGVTRDPIGVMVLITAMLALSATRTELKGDEARYKRPTMVLTTTGMIVRDASGLRSWQYEEMSDVRTCVCQGQMGIVVVLAGGAMHFIDNLSFARGEHVGGLIRRHLQPRRT